MEWLQMLYYNGRLQQHVGAFKDVQLGAEVLERARRRERVALLAKPRRLPGFACGGHVRWPEADLAWMGGWGGCECECDRGGIAYIR